MKASLREGFKKKKKKRGVFSPVGGGGGGGQTHFHTKKNRVSKCIKSPKYSFKSNLFFSYGGVWHLEYFWVPDSGLSSTKDCSLGNSHEAIPLTILVIVPLHQPSQTQCWQDRGGFWWPPTPFRSANDPTPSGPRLITSIRPTSEWECLLTVNILWKFGVSQKYTLSRARGLMSGLNNKTFEVQAYSLLLCSPYSMRWLTLI